MSKLIGLIGLKGSGKNAVGAILVQQHRAITCGFADQLKAGLAKMFEPLVDPQVWHDPARKEDRSPWGPTYRQIMQWAGTEFGRHLVAPNVWVDLLRPHIKSYLESGRTVVITDCRFGSEANFIEDLGGILVWVTRPHTATTTDPHISETGMCALASRCTYTIYNNGSLDELATTVAIAVQNNWKYTNEYL